MDVIVVGCGAAGVAALRALHDAGLRALGLEGGERAGGRLCTGEFGAHVVDLGAQWCHGENNCVFDLADPLNLLGRQNPEDKVYLLSDGSIVPLDTADEILNKLNGILASADKSTTLSIPQLVKTEAERDMQLLNHGPLSQSFLEWFERFNHVGGQSDPKRAKSVHGLVECSESKGDFMLNWKNRGYTTVLDILLKKYPNPREAIPVEILTKKEVETIKWKNSQPGLDAVNPLVQIKCKDGSLYTAKSVIVTVSIKVLQERHQQLFNPTLPEEKINAINNLQMCVLDKIYLEFEEPWWPKTPAYFSILWQKEDKNMFSKDKWITDIFGLSTVELQPNVLCAWIYGEGAKEMENVSLEAVREGIYKLLERLFKDKFKVNPIVDILRSKWASDPLTGGAYAYRCVDTETHGGGAKALSEPLLYKDKIPVVCFAGEATSLLQHGSVHGAVESGFREAKRIVEYLKL